MKINSTKDLKNKPSYILVYGASGIGKTTLFKTLPNLEGVLILDAESGLACLKGTDIADTSLARDDDEMLIPMGERYKRLQEFMVEVQLPATKARFHTLCIDSITEISQVIMAYMKDVMKYDGFQLWGEYTQAMMSLVKFFRDLEHYTVIFTGLEARIDDEVGQSQACPDVGGKKAKEHLLPAFDIVARMVVDGDGERKLVTKTTIKTQAKDRTGTLEGVESPHLGQILAKVRA